MESIMESDETPPTCTDNDTTGSLELIHEEAEELNRSMDLSLAFWGHSKEENGKVPATKLKCTSGRSNKSSELALLLWEKMTQQELEEVKKVEATLLKDGEICEEGLFNIVKNIVEGVGLPLRDVLSVTPGDEDLPSFVDVMAELLYIYNQNEQPEIKEEDEYELIPEKEDCRVATASTISEAGTTSSIEETDENEIADKINLLLEKAKQLNLGEIKVPSSLHLSSRSKLSIVERQVKAKIRLKHIRKMIQINQEGCLKNEEPCNNKKNNFAQRETNNKPNKDSVRSKSLGPSYHNANLQKRLKKASEMRKKLIEEKAKGVYDNNLNILGNKTENIIPKQKYKLFETENSFVSGCILKSEIEQLNSVSIECNNNDNTQRIHEIKQRAQSSSDLSDSKEFFIDLNQNNERLPFNSVANMSEMNEMLFFSFLQNQYPPQLISTTRNIIDESNITGRCHEELNSDRQFKQWLNNLGVDVNLSNDKHISNEKADEKFNEPFSYNIECTEIGVEHEKISQENESNKEEIVKLTDPNNNQINHHDVQTVECMERPCSRDEMISEMRKMLKEALSEMAKPSSYYQKEAPEDFVPQELILKNEFTSTKSQTTGSFFELAVNQDEATSCSEVVEETKVDIERKAGHGEDVVDIKIVQEAALPAENSSEKERKLSTEISVSQIGSGPVVKVSFVSTIKGHGLGIPPDSNRQLKDNGDALNNNNEEENESIPEKIEDEENKNEESSDEAAPSLFNNNLSQITSETEKTDVSTAPNGLDTDSYPPILLNSSSQFLPDSLSVNSDDLDLPPVNVNLAMFIQEYSPIPVKEELRSCGPFQMGGLLLSSKLGPPSVVEEIGDGCESQYYGPWNNDWKRQVWEENFFQTPPYSLTESDSLFVNTSDDALDGTDLVANCLDGSDSRDVANINQRTEETLDSNETTQRINSNLTITDVISGLTRIVISPITLPLYLLKSSIDLIFWRRKVPTSAADETSAES